MLAELGAGGILSGPLLTLVLSHATANAEQDVLEWIILTAAPPPQGQRQPQGVEHNATPPPPPLPPP